jgi:hypothetical protein
MPEMFKRLSSEVVWSAALYQPIARSRYELVLLVLLLVDARLCPPRYPADNHE